ncbi:hypothetical protein KB553_09550 [Chryseobacterium rhizoplanae]|uniref:hypothetical protein n=1 Tax=Chryseobacterium rhizoplanae TaxID=1609531 RepID=UPI001CE3191F|nr:hypothetical protein [Chryseobacterium rhizoplanae]UCA61758.1 hypothetical protein KB553_09550 [Chryseobacterium rhizoplanae]
MSKNLVSDQDFAASKTLNINRFYKMSKLISIRFYSHIFDAQKDKQVLVENGIHGFIANENLIKAAVRFSRLVGEIQLQVFDVDVKDALEALENHYHDQTYFVSKDKVPVCHKCGSDHIFRTEKLGLIKGWHILGLQINIQKGSYYCCYCDGEFIS